ncbi:YheC/YheD family protein [Cohnella caldifontis]|uniref:YheC/YheD family protein n=1 Tax=Cohnella caldifontis TaxID=3027471 RepID=UPI0023ECB576|nr:YheC/YheD family protein [Cohnella sp. YIM B05605]
MNRSRIRHVGSKWSKTKVILRDRALRPYVPETRRINAASLQAMLNRYRMVYVKPVSGMHGKGVMRVARTGAGGYVCRWGSSGSRYRGFRPLYEAIRKRTRGRPYLVQRGIRLLTVRGKLFDIRVMVQKPPGRKWKATGIIGRLARPGRVVTNYHSGGKPTDVRTLLRGYAKPARIDVLMRTMAAVSRRAAAALNRGYPGVNMVGADIGLDRSLKPWIIELNTSPDPYLFRFLKDKRVSRRVLRYARMLKRI